MTRGWQASALALACALALAGCRQTPPQQSRESGSTSPGTAQSGAPAGAAAPSPMAPAQATPAGGAAPSETRQAAPPPPEAPTASPAAATAAAPASEAPELREVTVPAGTAMTVVLETTVSSDGSAVEDAVRGHLANAVRVGGVTALPAGTALIGTVVEAKPYAKVKGRARIAFRFDRLTAHGEDHDARTSLYAREAQSTKRKDAKKIGIGAGAGAIVGGIIGGGKGAAIGAGVGGGAGTGVVLSTKGEEVAVRTGAQVRVTLQEAVTVRVRLSAGR